MVFQESIQLSPQEKGATEITELISEILQTTGIQTGICQLFVHNSQSCLLINDTADENTRSRTADFLAQLAPSSDEITSSIDSSMDAIPEAMREAITRTDISFPVKAGKPVLGIWQGIYLWERTDQPRARKLTITVVGE